MRAKNKIIATPKKPKLKIITEEVAWDDIHHPLKYRSHLEYGDMRVWGDPACTKEAALHWLDKEVRKYLDMATTYFEQTKQGEEK